MRAHGAESLTSSRLDGLLALRGALADLFFPPSRALCGRYGAWLCPQCAGSIETIQPPVCPRCGAPECVASSSPQSALPAHSKGRLCENCRVGRSRLDGIRACAILEGHIRTVIHRFKYEHLTCLAEPLGELMVETWPVLAPTDLRIDAIVPVPLHRARLRERGYNQSALLARVFGACLGWPVVEGVLIRRRATVPQVGLSSSERWNNVQGAFECTADTLHDQRVLLIDDVFTTGSTLEAACEALRRGGTFFVWAYTLARAS